jgi:hypothetical protein
MLVVHRGQSFIAGDGGTSPRRCAGLSTKKKIAAATLRNVSSALMKSP